VTGIYEIRCTANGKRYIGSALDVKSRWRTHRSQLNGQRHGNRHLQHAWNKYGAGAFEWAVLEEVPRRDLIAAEQRYVDALLAESPKSLFNLKLKVDSPLGMKRTAETCARISAAKTGLKISDEGRRSLSESCKERLATNPSAMAAAVERMSNAQAISAAQRRAQTYCKRGHEFTPENTYLVKKGRGCRICQRASRRRRRGQKLDNLFAPVGRKILTHCKRGHPLSGDNIVEVAEQRYCRACREMRIAERTVRRRKLRAA